MTGVQTCALPIFHKLFATYEGKRYRVTYASRMGDVCLSSDHSRAMGYDLRVDVEKCSEWGPDPNRGRVGDHSKEDAMVDNGK